MLQSSSHVLLLSLQLFCMLVLCSSSVSGAVLRSLAQSPSCNNSLQVHCGGSTFEARDPFTGLDANGSCRSLVTCNADDGSFRMEINSLQYNVSSVDYAARKMVIASVADVDQLELNFCAPRLNGSMDVSPFAYTENDVLITQARNCSGEEADELSGVARCGLYCHPRSFIVVETEDLLLLG